MDPVNAQPQQNIPKAQLLQDIGNASRERITELMTIVISQYNDDIEVMRAYVARQNTLMNAVPSENRRVQNQVSTYIGPNGAELSDLDLSGRIRTQIPPNTYTEIKVTTIEHNFINGMSRARKIELIRVEWGLLRIPFIESTAAFFSSLFVTNSTYREVIEQNLLVKGILASSEIVGDQDNALVPNEDRRQQFQLQLTAAYWRGKRIEIIVPFDFSQNGQVGIFDDSKFLTFSINSGRWIRSLFTNG